VDRRRGFELAGKKWDRHVPVLSSSRSGPGGKHARRGRRRDVPGSENGREPTGPGIVIAPDDAYGCQIAGLLPRADWLRDELKIYSDLKSGRAHPASVFPELAECRPDDAKQQALERAAEDIAADAGVLIQVIDELTGRA